MNSAKGDHQYEVTPNQGEWCIRNCYRLCYRFLGQKRAFWGREPGTDAR
jgi:hypothetical protein